MLINKLMSLLIFLYDDKHSNIRIGLVVSRLKKIIVLIFFKILGYLKWEAAFAPIYFQVIQSDKLTNNIHWVEISYELPFYLQIEL